jgi:hypothetical protein
MFLEKALFRFSIASSTFSQLQRNIMLHRKEMEIAAFFLQATEKCLKGYWKALGNAQRLLDSL